MTVCLAPPAFSVTAAHFQNRLDPAVQDIFVPGDPLNHLLPSSLTEMCVPLDIFVLKAVGHQGLVQVGPFSWSLELHPHLTAICALLGNTVSVLELLSLRVCALLVSSV